MSWLDYNYITMLSGQLRNFKAKSSKLWQMSCPYCGDSTTDKRKARGYIYIQHGNYVYHCHKCSKHTQFRYFLKDINYGLYQDYVKDYLLDQGKVKHVEDNLDKFKQPQVFKKDLLSSLTKISQLDVDNYAKQYVNSRLIPSEFHYNLYLCDEFKGWTNKIVPDKFDNIIKDEARLIIPFQNANGTLIGYQGRSFAADTKLRYITIMLDESFPKIYGLDRIDIDQTMYVVEGPLDSLFIPNCLASAGGSITTDLATIHTDTRRFVIIYDNEPRSKHTVKKMERAINSGFNVCIWPDSISGSDPNDMIMGGMSLSRLKSIIDENTYHGLAATLQLQKWKKC